MSQNGMVKGVTNLEIKDPRALNSRSRGSLSDLREECLTSLHVEGLRPATDTSSPKYLEEIGWPSRRYTSRMYIS